MKIQIENNGINVTVEMSTPFIVKKEVMDICDKVYDITNSFYKPTSDDTDISKAVEDTKQYQPKAVLEKDTMVIRPRIPNNVVDVNDLTIEKAVTENALVRCPHCGQAHCLAVNSGNKVYVMERDFNANDFNIIAEFDSITSQAFAGMCCKPETDKLAYFNDLQGVVVISHDDFAVDNNTEVFCPVCCTSNNFLEWKKAFDNPLQYFETEHICDVCGGEKLEKIIKGKKVYLCDSCGYQIEYEEE